MRAFLNLSVGLKLLTSSLLALAMLGGIAGTVTLTDRQLSETLARQDRLDEASALLTEAMGTVAEAPSPGADPAGGEPDGGCGGGARRCAGGTRCGRPSWLVAPPTSPATPRSPRC